MQYQKNNMHKKKFYDISQHVYFRNIHEIVLYKNFNGEQGVKLNDIQNNKNFFDVHIVYRRYSGVLIFKEHNRLV
jgi:hypothetical protein